jgi:hypothetical protein
MDPKNDRTKKKLKNLKAHILGTWGSGKEPKLMHWAYTNARCALMQCIDHTSSAWVPSRAYSPASTVRHNSTLLFTKR